MGLSGQEILKLEDIALAFPHLNLPDQGHFKTTISCHCELTVALHAKRTNPTPTPIEIRVSKRIFWLCQKYLEKLSVHYNARLLISEYQGKCHAGQRLPPSTPSEVEKSMRLLLDAQIVGTGHRSDWKVVELTGRSYEYSRGTWKDMQSHGRSWKLVECSVSVIMYDLEVPRNFQNSLLQACISSISHVYKGSQASHLKEQCELSCLLQYR